MNRRWFLGRLAALTGATVTAPAVRAAAHEKIELQRSRVAGFQYHQGDAVWPLLAVGASLSLIREPDNAYDTRAVRIDWQGHKLGYVPRADNAAISHLLDEGRAVTASIISLQESANPWERIGLTVHLDN